MPYTGIKYLPYVCSGKEVPKDIYQGQIHSPLRMKYLCFV